VAALTSLTGGAAAHANQAGHLKPTAGQLHTIAALQKAQSQATSVCKKAGAGTAFDPVLFAGAAARELRMSKRSPSPWDRLPADQIVFGCYPSLSYNVLGTHVDQLGHRSSAPALDTGTKGLKCRGNSTSFKCPIVGVGG
jgi:hypothetical protein